MKAIILAVEVIEMAQEGSSQDRTRRLPTKVIREDRRIALGMALLHAVSPITAHQSPLPTQSAERLQKQKEIERPKRT